MPVPSAAAADYQAAAITLPANKEGPACSRLLTMRASKERGPLLAYLALGDDAQIHVRPRAQVIVDARSDGPCHQLHTLHMRHSRRGDCRTRQPKERRGTLLCRARAETTAPCAAPAWHAGAALPGCRPMPGLRTAPEACAPAI